MNNDGINVVANRSVRHQELRLLGANRELIGIMSSKKAFDLAQSKGLDLIELASNAKPPVCFLGDLNKYIYEQKQKLKEQKKLAKANAKASELKEIHLRPVTGEADFKRLITQGNQFLAEGHKIKITITFKGREQSHITDCLDRMVPEIIALIDNGQMDGTPSHAGNRINIIFIPKKS
jgi:translation initiation factor IF-3